MDKERLIGSFFFRYLLTGSLFLGTVFVVENLLIAKASAESPAIISGHNTKTGDEQKTITVKMDEQIHFSIITAQANNWEWKVDGVAVANNSFPFLSMKWPNTGNHTVEVRAGDGSTWTNSITWNVTVRVLTLSEMATRFYNPHPETWFGMEWSSRAEYFGLWGSNWLAFVINPWQDGEVKTVALMLGGIYCKPGTPSSAPTSYALRLENESGTALAWPGSESPYVVMPDSTTILANGNTSIPGLARGGWWIKFPLNTTGAVVKGQKYRIKLQSIGGGDRDHYYTFRNMYAEHGVASTDVVGESMYFANEGYSTSTDKNQYVTSDGATPYTKRQGAYLLLDKNDNPVSGLVYSMADYPGGASQKIISDNEFRIDMAGWLSSLRAGDIRKIELTENEVVIASKTETQPGYVDWYRMVNVVPPHPLRIFLAKNYLLQNIAISSQWGTAWYLGAQGGNNYPGDIPMDEYDPNNMISNLTWGGAKWHGEHYGQYNYEGAFLLHVHPVVGYWPQGVNVPANEKISIAFNKPMDHPSTETAFSISPAVSGAFSWSGQNGNIAVFTPTGNFSADTQYTVTLDTTAQGASSDPRSDVLGNHTFAPFSWTFNSVDSLAPSSITNLTAGNPTADSVTLSWTAPGDNGEAGTAASYDIRYSISSISESNWALAAPVVNEPTPAVAGTAETMIVPFLNSSTLYYFAIKTADEVPNLSALSNVNSASTSRKGGYSYDRHWIYRKPITIQGGLTDQSNYQVKVTVSFILGKMNNDFSDIRFTTIDGKTSLSYYLDSSVPSLTADFWVKVPSVPITGTTIYLYYGNPGASDSSDAVNTFDLFDDFTTDTWTDLGSLAVGVDAVNQYLYQDTVNSGLPPWSRSIKQINLGTNSFKFEFEINILSHNSTMAKIYVGFYKRNNSIGSFSTSGDDALVLYNPESAGKKFYFGYARNQAEEAGASYISHSSEPPFTYTFGATYHVFMTRTSATNATLKMYDKANNILLYTANLTIPIDLELNYVVQEGWGYKDAGRGIESWTDNYRIRKYLYGDLAISMGEEEIVSTLDLIDETPPVVSIITPQKDAKVVGVVPIEAEASDDLTLSKVEFYIDEAAVNTFTNSPYKWLWETKEVAEGQHRIKVIAYDGDGNKSEQEITVTVTKLSGIAVYPNPYIKGKSGGKKITFVNLAKEATIRIYTTAGKLMATLEHKESSSGSKEEWDVSEVNSGIYLYVITSSEGTKKGKVSVIK